MKDWQKALGVAGVGIGGFLLGARSVENRMNPEPKDISLNNVLVDIQTYTLNEESFLGKTAKSIVSQPLFQKCRENFTLTLVDSKSTDRTREIAKKYYDRIWITERGKLNARDFGARKSSSDILIPTDADTTYPPGWLSNILEPFSDSNVVATHGAVVSDGSVWSPFRSWVAGTEFYRTIFTARNSAFRRAAYFECGGFDLSVDQFDRDGELNQEEECRFKEKLEGIGEVRYVDIAVSTSERQMPLVLEDGVVEKYKEEQEKGIRF